MRTPPNTYHIDTHTSTHMHAHALVPQTPYRFQTQWYNLYFIQAARSGNYLRRLLGDVPDVSSDFTTAIRRASTFKSQNPISRSPPPPNRRITQIMTYDILEYPSDRLDGFTDARTIRERRDTVFPACDRTPNSNPNNPKDDRPRACIPSQNTAKATAFTLLEHTRTGESTASVNQVVESIPQTAITCSLTARRT